MKAIKMVLVVAIVGLFCSPMAFGGGQKGSLSLSQMSFDPGEDIVVEFEAPEGLSDTAWIGIIPSNVPHGSEEENDNNDIAYQYLKGRTSGSMTFKAPSEPGSYDLRMNSSDSDGEEIASVTFTVGGGNTSGGSGGGGDNNGEGSLRLDKNNFTPGERIIVHFTAPQGLPDNAWVGIIPSNVPHGSENENDAHDITYQYLHKRTSGDLIFNAPQQPGAFDFRMNDRDDNGTEIASVSFTVE